MARNCDDNDDDCKLIDNYYYNYDLIIVLSFDFVKC